VQAREDVELEGAPGVDQCATVATFAKGASKTCFVSYGEILRQLEQREICTTKDRPIGGYGEWLVARAFGDERQSNSNKSVDVIAPDGVRLQVKARWLPLEGGSRQLSVIRNLDKGGFDYIVAVLLNLPAPDGRVGLGVRVGRAARRPGYVAATLPGTSTAGRTDRSMLAASLGLLLVSVTALFRRRRVYTT